MRHECSLRWETATVTPDRAGRMRLRVDLSGHPNGLWRDGFRRAVDEVRDEVEVEGWQVSCPVTRSTARVVVVGADLGEEDDLALLLESLVCRATDVTSERLSDVDAKVRRARAKAVRLRALFADRAAEEAATEAELARRRELAATRLTERFRAVDPSRAERREILPDLLHGDSVEAFEAPVSAEEVEPIVRPRLDRGVDEGRGLEAFFSARAEDLDDGRVERGPEFPYIYAFGLTAVSIAKLGEILGAGASERLLDDIGEATTESGEAGLLAIPSAFRDALAAEPDLDVVAERWKATQDVALQGAEKEYLVEWLCELAELARTAAFEDEDLWAWWSAP